MIKESVTEIKVPYRDKQLYFNVRDYADIDERVTDRIVLREAFEENTYSLHEDDFNDTGIMIDIGANIGAVSILAHQLGAKDIYSFEPVPANFELLSQNLFLNMVWAKAVNKALWSHPGKLQIVSAQAASTSNPEALKAYPGKIVEMECTTLADVLAPFERVDVLKCDTEGAEYEIFGDPEVNVKARKIVIEFHIAPIEKVGALFATLSLTHNIQAFGNWQTRGGQILALRY